MKNNNFQWTDEKVKEFISSRLPLPQSYLTGVQQILDEFKSSHTPTGQAKEELMTAAGLKAKHSMPLGVFMLQTADILKESLGVLKNLYELKKLRAERKSAEQPIVASHSPETTKERITVRIVPNENYGGGKWMGFYVVEPTKPIPENKLTPIKQAIESILNDDAGEQGFVWDAKNIKYLLIDLEEYFDDKADVDAGIPNLEAKWLVKVQELLKQFPKHSAEQKPSQGKQGWEVVAYSSPYGGQEDVIYTKKHDGWFWVNKWNRYREEQVKNHVRTKIFSVIRKSDGCVFTVGEEVVHFTGDYKSKIIGLVPDRLGWFYFEEDKTHVKDLSNFEKLPPVIIKPPLGIIPEWMHKEIRLQDLDEAIKRFCDAEKPVPINWIVESYNLREWIENRKEEINKIKTK